MAANAFDVTCCFGLTMWIHQNRGDDGLAAFLRGLAAATRSTYKDDPDADREYDNLGEGP